MIRAYQEIYVNKIQRRIGVLFDYAINVLGINCNKFIDIFSSCKYAKYIENGYLYYVVGKSGIEIALDLFEAELRNLEIKQFENYNRTIDYWIGWAISYYQWYSNRSFNEIFNILKYSDLEKMYYKYHEVDILKFVEELDIIMQNHNKETNLKRIRNLYGISQNELAKLSNVNKRSIQMYEEKYKNINKANVITIYMLSKALGCQIEDLLEK